MEYEQRSFRFGDGIEASIWLLSEFKGKQFDAKQQGLYLWPGAERLCRFAAYNPHLFAQKRVIELGAGAGLGSAVVAQLGPSELVVTDGSEQVMDLLRRNVNENLNRAPQRVESGENGDAHQGEDCSMVEQNNGGTTTAAATTTTKVQVLSLGWSADEEELKAARDSEGRELCHTFDVVFGSDVIYEYANIVPLLTTARALLSDDARAFLVLAYVHRSDYLWDEMRRHAQELGLTCEVESESTGGGGQLGRILIFRKMRS